MAETVKSTRAKVRDAEKVREVLDAYAWDGVEIKLQEEGSGWTLEMAYHDEEPGMVDWPQAVKREELPSGDEDTDEDDLIEAQADVYDKKGDEGFLALLRELAAHFESPLLILAAAGPDGKFYSGAEVWRVEPGAKEVESLAV
jgi:hypothetical protein